MRCLNCGNEIGEKKVCPICNTPIRNVLCGQGDKQMLHSDETQIMYMADFEGIEFENAETQETVTENGATGEIAEEKITEGRNAVITDEFFDKLLCIKPEKKKWSVKKSC